MLRTTWGTPPKGRGGVRRATRMISYTISGYVNAMGLRATRMISYKISGYVGPISQ